MKEKRQKKETLLLYVFGFTEGYTSSDVFVNKYTDLEDHYQSCTWRSPSQEAAESWFCK